VKRFEVVEHTADVGILVYGKNLPELFENAPFGMFSILVEDLLEKVKPLEKIEIQIDGVDFESLLVNFLNELIFLFSARKMLFVDFKVLSLEKFFLKAEVFGEKIDVTRHKLNFEIKSATYHNLKIEKINEIWRCQIIFDV